MTADPHAIGNLTAALMPILAWHPPETQGAALADCLAYWLAGHDVPGDEDATRKWRAALLEMHCNLVRQLVPLNALQIDTTP